jgi:ABC-type transport system involved in multi-copper enzyme maturation permease subunit
MWTLGVTVVLGIGLSALVAAETKAHWVPADRPGFDPTQLSLIGVFFGQFTLGILGVLVMSAEYGTGTIRATFSAAPRRPLVLAAKPTVFGMVALVVSEVVGFAAYFLGQSLLTAPAIHTTLGSPGALRAVIGSGLYLCALGLFALGLAAIIRHTTARSAPSSGSCSYYRSSSLRFRRHSRIRSNDSCRRTSVWRWSPCDRDSDPSRLGPASCCFVATLPLH